MGIDISLELGSALEKYRANKIYNKENYDELLNKYEEAVRIRELENTILDLQRKKLPSPGEVESMRAILNLFGIEKLDANGIHQLSQVQSLIKSTNG